MNEFDLNQGSNEKPKAKVIVIAVLVVALILVGGILLFNSFNSGDNDNSGLDNNSAIINNGGSWSLKSIEIYSQGIIGLTNDNALYAIGKFGAFKNIKVLGDGDKIVKISDNVIDYSTAYGLAVYYVDKDNDLYRAGGDFKGGELESFEKAYDDIDSYMVYKNFCLSVVNKKGEMYIHNGIVKGHCGFSYQESTNGFKKVADNVKKPIVGNKYNGYIDQNNDLYVSIDGGNTYKKIIDDVIDYNDNLFLTRDGKLYSVKDDNANLLFDNVEKITSSGRFYKIKGGNFYGFSKYDTDSDYLEFSSDDIVDVLYSDNDYFSLGKAVVINNDGDFVLYNNGTIYKTLKNTYESMKDILNFIS